jgi:hypothetical protein
MIRRKCQLALSIPETTEPFSMKFGNCRVSTSKLIGGIWFSFMWERLLMELKSNFISSKDVLSCKQLVYGINCGCCDVQVTVCWEVTQYGDVAGYPHPHITHHTVSQPISPPLESSLPWNPQIFARSLQLRVYPWFCMNSIISRVFKSFIISTVPRAVQESKR